MRGRTVSFVLLLVSILLALAVAAAASAANPNPRVLPVNGKPYGQTYGEWSAAWWQYVYSVPTSSNPLFDTSGANCDVGQSGPVFFLVGATTSSAVDRACTVPSGKALFFPVLNNECDNIPDFQFTIDELRSFCKAPMDAATNMSVSVDGVPIAGLDSTASPYRVQSPVFSITLPEDNIYSFGVIPAGTYEPAVGDGYYVMLAPLSAGMHTVDFGGASGSFTLDITYHLTVGG